MMICSTRVVSSALILQMRSDSIQDLSFGRDSDRYGSLPKHISDSFHLRTTSSPGDAQKDLPAGLSGQFSARDRNVSYDRWSASDLPVY
jgi:hypothetical protein